VLSPMKVETNLTLVKGQEATGDGPKRNSRLSRQASSPVFELLISQENQQARRLDPASLPEARTLLNNITRQLDQGLQGRSPSGVHLLDSSCLVRLP
jgi:hypothetical protein